MMQEARLRLYISALRGFPFCLSVSQYHGDRVLTTQQRHCTSLYNVKLLVSSVFWDSFTSRWPDFIRFTWRQCTPLLQGQGPQACWPLCLFAAALIHRCLLPAEQLVCDLLTWLFAGRVWLVATVIGSFYPLSLTTLRSLIGQACQEGGRTRGYGIGYCPGGAGSMSTATSQLKENPNQTFKKQIFVDPCSKSTVWSFFLAFSCFQSRLSDHN